MNGHLSNKTKEELLGKNKNPEQSLQWSKAESLVPKLHWCGHYLDPQDKSRVIQDGEQCCWWHYIGLPTRFGKRHPAYPWQEDVFKEYFHDHQKYFYFGKVPKMGATQTWLSIALHEALTNPEWANGQVAFVVGTHGVEAEHTIARCKELIAYKDEEGRPLFDHDGDLRTRFEIDVEYNNKKEFTLNSVEFRAHPSKNIDSIRSQPNMRMIMVDELAFFDMVEQQRIRDAFEHYIGNSDVIIVLITTAGDAPEGVAYEIENEEPSIYRKHLYDYNIGLVVHPESMTSLFKKSDIDLIRNSPSFNRNYLRQWGFGSGDIFKDSEITNCIKNYQHIVNPGSYVEADIDPGYGSSKFAILIWQKVNGKMQILFTIELERPSQSDALKIIRTLIPEYNIQTLRIDSSRPDLVAEFSDEINTISQNFRETGLEMLSDAASLVANGLLEIDVSFEDLIRQMRAAKRDKKDGNLDKKIMSFDLFDALRMGCYGFKKGSGYGLIARFGSDASTITKNDTNNVIRKEINLSRPKK